MGNLINLDKLIDRTFLSIWVLWSFINLTILLFWGTPSGIIANHVNINTRIHFVPFTESWYNHFGLQYYDYSEFIFYCLLPFILFFTVKLLLPQKNNASHG